MTRLIAHRGIHQIHTGDNRTNETCRAESVKTIEHRFIENTIPSMRTAFSYGADVVELDVHLTVDNVLAVFHDWRLECQTDGVGVTHKQNYKYLKSLDIGYGFSDDGKTYPLRGNSDERIPRLVDVLESDMEGKFLVNFKSDRIADGQQFVQLMADPEYLRKLFGVYGGQRPTRTTIDLLDTVRGYDRSSLKSCAKSYVAIGWSGYVPAICKNAIIAIPMNYAPLLWGWPHRFTSRMRAANTAVILLGPYDGSGFSSGIDDADTLSRVPNKFDGYIWTNAIEVIGPLVIDDDRF